MAADEPPTTLHIPERVIPVPTSVSSEARAILSMGSLGPTPSWPPLDDSEAWRTLIKASDDGVLAMMAEGGRMSGLAPDSTTIVDELYIGQCTVFIATPEGIDPGDRRVYLDIHGGAWVFGAGEVCRLTSQTAARDLEARVWSVDYRMPPEHPYPAALDDCLAAYRRLLEEREPGEIVVGGGSAGGNLAAALLLRARDEGLPMPAALVLQTGALDLTLSGDSWSANQGLDPVLSGDFGPPVRLYAAGHDLQDPYLSPLFGNLEGLPPTILTTSTRDLLLSDNARMHRALLAAGVRAELHVWEAAGHGGFLGTAPEDADRAGEVRRFANENWIH